jgi:hypothetical protein
MNTAIRAAWVMAILTMTAVTAAAQLSITSSSRRSFSAALADDGNSRLEDEEEIESSTLVGPFTAATAAEQHPPGGAITEFARSSATLTCDFSNLAAGTFRAFGTTTARAETINVTGFDPDSPPYNSGVGESYVYTIFDIGSQQTNYSLTATTFTKAPDAVLVFALVGLKEKFTVFGTVYVRTDIKRFTSTGTMTGTLDPLNDTFDRYEIQVYSRNNAYVESDGAGSLEVVDGTNHFDFSVQLTPVPHTAAYDTWVSLNFTSEQIAAGEATAHDADPDADGVSNLMEYALNLSPTSSGAPVVEAETGTSGLPLIAPAATESTEELSLHVEYIRRKASAYPGITYTLQLSTDLAGGPASWASATGSVNVTSIDATWERVTIDTTPVQSTALFGRLLVTMQ